MRLDFVAADLSRSRRMLLALAALIVAAAIWLPCVHLFFKPGREYRSPGGGIAPRAKAMAAYQARLWTDAPLHQSEVQKMRASNAEWDFMGRTFFVLALANMALREPAQKARDLELMDRIISETIALEKERGHLFWLMDYAKGGEFRGRSGRSLFVDGEIALMLGARRLVEEKPEYKPLLTRLVDDMVERMRAEPLLCAESYPNECWMFCNTAALAAMRIADVLDGSDHGELFRDWLDKVKLKLVDPKSGMLVSSFTLNGSVRDGPEGSSIWMAAHCLQLVDGEFARDQYQRAREELGRRLLGFGYAREWPLSYVGPLDVDSGPVVPVLGASPAASGLGLMAARSFGDEEFFAALCTSLDFAAFPRTERGALKYCASNAVGDAVMLYALVLGPLWQEVERRARR